jgi:hypothetical protein
MESKADRVKKYLSYYVFIAVFFGVVQMVNYQMARKEDTAAQIANTTIVENTTTEYVTSTNSTNSSLSVYATMRL